jgi:hypothetical protein
MSQQRLPARIKVISATWTPGTSRSAMSAGDILRQLDRRPGGKYAYVRGVRHRAVCTIAETKGGAGVAFPVADQIQMLRSMTLEHDKNPRMTDVSFLDLVRFTQQGQEILSPDVLGTTPPVRLPTADIASASGTVSVTLDFVKPLAPSMYKRGASQRAKHTGAISIASLVKSGKLEVLGAAAANMTGAGADYWSCTSIAYDCWLEMYYSDYPIEEAKVRESYTESATAPVMADCEGERRLLIGLVTDHDDADMPANSDDGIITIDSNVLETSVSSAELVTEANTLRLDGINDIYPDCIPIVTLTDRDVEECPIIHSSCKLEHLNSGHGANAYHFLTMQSQRWDLETQRQKFKAQYVPNAAIARYIDAVNKRSVTEARDEIGLAVRVLANEEAMGVEEYAGV